MFPRFGWRWRGWWNAAAAAAVVDDHFVGDNNDYSWLRRRRAKWQEIAVLRATNVVGIVGRIVVVVVGADEFVQDGHFPSPTEEEVPSSAALVALVEFGAVQ
jgi:hypothetical protein